MKLLAVGYSVRQIACSGARASHKIISADAFGDVDTRVCSSKFIHLNFPLNDELKHLEHIADEVDGAIVSSGCENAIFGEKLSEKIIGNSPEKMRKAANKEKLAECLDALGIPHPQTYTQSDVISLSSLRFPLIAKPIHGGGGTSNFLCTNERELRKLMQNALQNALNSHKHRFIFQEFVKGTPASVSVISTGKEAVSICVNEQLVGLKSLNCVHQFVYCGNISPLKTKYAGKMCDVAETLILELGLKGSNGVDFMITKEGFVVLEVNPRFQGSLDTVELCTGLNVVNAHLKAVCEGEIPMRDARRDFKRYAARLILFAERNCIASDFLRLGGVGNFCDFGDFSGDEGERSSECSENGRCKSGRCEVREWIADIPPRGRVLRKGEPVASGIGVGRSREDAVEAAMDVVTKMKQCMI